MMDCSRCGVKPRWRLPDTSTASPPTVAPASRRRAWSTRVRIRLGRPISYALLEDQGVLPSPYGPTRPAPRRRPQRPIRSPGPRSRPSPARTCARGTMRLSVDLAAEQDTPHADRSVRSTSLPAPTGSGAPAIASSPAHRHEGESRCRPFQHSGTKPVEADIGRSRGSARRRALPRLAPGRVRSGSFGMPKVALPPLRARRHGAGDRPDLLGQHHLTRLQARRRDGQAAPPCRRSDDRRTAVRAPA